MELTKQKELVDSATAWFDGKFKTAITENRRRYRMQLKDSQDRTSRGLSALPSTKTTSAVDRYVDRLAIEMFQDPDSISFTSKSQFDPSRDLAGAILTQDFIYRSKRTFPFFTWHQASSLAGAVDGVEAAIVWWRHEFYNQPITEYRTATGESITKDIYDRYSQLDPEMFQAVEGQRKVVLKDTWWVDSLEPGKDIIWDPTIGLMDVELGQFVYVKLQRTKDQLRAMADIGVLDGAMLTDEVLRKNQKTPASTTTYSLSGDKTVDNGQDVDLKGRNTIELGVFFHKEGNRWYVCFSLGGLTTKVSEPKPVNEVWFNGRPVHILPVSVGYNKPKLLEQVGWSIPELIAPLEDEHVNHRNNVNDAAKIAIQGRWWVDEGGNTNLDNLLNSRVVYGREGSDFGPMNTNLEMVSSLRADDIINAEINELIPAGMQSGARGIVPKGTNKTLGATQLGKLESDEKMGVQIVTRNETFFYKVLYLIAQLTITFETDETILRIAASKAGMALPTVTLPDGRQIPDLSAIDVDVDVQINAGLGSAPRYQKAQTTMQLVDWGKTHDLRVDALAAYRQLSVLAGYGPDDMLDKSEPPAPPPPQVDYKLSLTMTLAELLAAAPQAAGVLEEKLMLGQVSVDAKVKDDSEARMREQQHNGMPDRTGEIVDGMGGSAMGMSMGGMQS